MTDDDRLASLLRSGLSMPHAPAPSRDLWPLVVDRIASPVRFSWIDIGLAACATVALLIFPQWFMPLAFHL